MLHAPAVLRIPEVVARTGLSRSSIYSKMADGSFPRSFALSPRAIGFLEADISSWIEARVAESRRPHRAAAAAELRASGTA